MVNGYFCRNCADEEIAKKGMDPAKPAREFAGSEVFVPAWMTKDGGKSHDKFTTLGVNKPDPTGNTGTALNLYA
jgi:hypothetical protein